jgi:hypothetical protein
MIIMEIQEAINLLKSDFENEEWFVDMVADNKHVPGRIIIHVKWLSEDIINVVPEYIAGYQVLIHFEKRIIKNNIVSDSVLNSVLINPTELNIDDLIKELGRLERICGLHTLQDIFYEIQDGEDAVTDMSERYPEVRKQLEELFNIYGFDVIYEEICRL